MDENKNPQTQPETAQDPGKPLSEKRKAALLRYMTILFSAAFVLVLISLILQMHSSEAKISELNARQHQRALQRRGAAGGKPQPAGREDRPGAGKQGAAGEARRAE